MMSFHVQDIVNENDDVNSTNEDESGDAEVLPPVAAEATLTEKQVKNHKSIDMSKL